MARNYIYSIVFAGLCLLSACTPPQSSISPRGSSAITRRGIQKDLSYYQISCFSMDDKDLLWIGTDKSVISFDGRNSRFFYASEDDNRLTSGNVLCMYDDHSRNVWIGTDKGLCSYIRYNRFENYLSDGEPLRDVSQIFETSDKVLIVKSSDGYYMMNPDKSMKRLSSLHTDGGTSVAVPDNNGGLWINTGTSSFHYDRYYNLVDSIDSNELKEGGGICAVKGDNDEMWLAQSGNLSCINVDNGQMLLNAGNIIPENVCFLFYDEPFILIKSDDKGLTVFDTRTEEIVSPSIAYIPSTPSRTDISSLYRDKMGNLWIGYKHFGVKCISKEDKELAQLNDIPLRRATDNKYINSIAQDHDGTIWGCAEGFIFKSDEYGKEVKVFDNTSISAPGIVKDITVSDGNVWLMDEVSVYRFAENSHGARLICRLKADEQINDFVASKDKCYAVSTSKLYIVDDKQVASFTFNDKPDGNPARLLDIGGNDLMIIKNSHECFFFNKKTHEITPVQIQTDLGTLLTDRSIIDAVLIDNTVCMASEKGEVLSLNNETGQMTIIEELAKIYISSFLSCSNNNLIMGSEHGVVYYNLEDKSLRVYSIGLDGKTYSITPINGTIKGKGSLIAGTNYGCIAIPASIAKVASDHHLSVHGVSLRDEESTRTVYLPKDESICVLNYDNNSFEISFGTVSYDNQPISTQYMLEGYNPYWIENNIDNVAYFSKIPAGKYCFKLRELQPFTNNVLNEKEMQIIVKKAPWNTIPALLLYIVLALSAIVLIYRFVTKIKEGSMKLSLAEQKNELEHRTNQMNMNFFANIVHEFRNPLTIISAPLSSLLKDDSLSNQAHKKLSAISASANTMLKLIDQMLDFNQLEMDVLKLCVGEHDITFELSKLADIFQESAHPREITVECSGLEEPFITLVDFDKFEKIINNLFTNALKHTPDSGCIRIEFDDITIEEAQTKFPDAELSSSRYFSISIINNGKNIPDDKIGNVFKRYFQSTDTSAVHNYGWGRGIGLYYVERLVNIHKGAIKVYNIQNGVCFNFIIPTDADIYNDVDREDCRVHRIMQIDIPKEESKDISTEISFDDKPVLYVVDDDIQVGQYIRSIFEDKYRVINKYSAEAALQEMDKVCPDIIISDVMMGKMSGFEFCKTVKSDLMYSHIPIILITAKTNIEDSVSGLECGASAYVTKPFSAEYLQALIASLLKNIENVRASLNSNTEANMLDGQLSDQDKAFISEVYNLMDKHLSDADLSVSAVCEELRISRSKFNYKLKGLTGCTPGAFFRQYKLNLAAKLLKEGKHNVSEISDMMGFASISNFSASFKKMFGVAPRDYK